MWRCSIILIGIVMLTGCEERHNDIGQKIILVAKKELMKGGRVNTIPYENLPDDALQKYVGKGSPLYDRQYVPTDLVKLQSSQTLQIQGERSLRQEAYEHLSQLSLAFYEYFHQPIVVMSAYRSYYHQKNQIAESCKANGYCAKEGESEHQLGLAIDLWEATNEEKFLEKHQTYYDWLRENAHLYGFHQSYQKGKSIDGYAIEPRHRRYLGENLAKELQEKKITFSELIAL